jgi:hypothetical protein
MDVTGNPLLTPLVCPEGSTNTNNGGVPPVVSGQGVDASYPTDDGWY